MPIEQAGAIPWRRRNGAIEFLIVTTNAGGWSIPKGGIDPGESTPEAAEREAREEAGVEGDIDEKVFAEYDYSKFGKRLHVTVHLLKVTSLLDEWDEKHERERKWIPAATVAGEVSYPNIAELLKRAASALDVGQTKDR